MKWDCLEPLAAIGCGLAVCAAPIDGGITAALVGGAGLLARFKAARAKAGFDDARLIEKMRIAVIRDWERDDQPQAERDAVGLAATAMGKHILDCLPTREQLAATALQGAGVYPAAAARLVVDRLAERDALFAAPEDGGEPSIARRFALDVVERSLRQAKDDPDYAPLLTLDLVIEIAGGVGRIEAKVDDTNAMVRALFEEMRATKQAHDVTDEALIALARKIADKVDDPRQALQALGEAIDEFIRQRDQAERGTNLGELVDRTLRNIAAANERGALDEGAHEGERAFAEWREQQEAARQGGLRLIEANIEQHRLRFDADAMAHWIGERLALENGGTINFKTLRAEQDRWFVLGRDRALRLELDVSIALARLSVTIAQSDKERASAQNDLAIALRVQSERTGGDAGLALLAEAIAVYRAALTLRTESGAPSSWAMMQNNLGNALQGQGERTEGNASLASLNEALAAFRAALTVYSESTAPNEWAMTQNNLGNTLAILGERAGAEEDLILLNEAVTAFRAALTVRTETAMPVKWAMTQNNLGNALRVKSGRVDASESLAVLSESVAAFRAALSVRTESRMPADWATTQNNLGNALHAQGKQTEGDAGLALLAEAIKAYRAAMTVRTEAATPPQWAMTQNNLGNVLRTRGERTPGDAGSRLLHEAAAAYRAALAVWTVRHFSYQHGIAQENLASVMVVLDQRSE